MAATALAWLGLAVATPLPPASLHGAQLPPLPTPPPTAPFPTLPPDIPTPFPPTPTPWPSGMATVPTASPTSTESPSLTPSPTTPPTATASRTTEPTATARPTGSPTSTRAATIAATRLPLFLPRALREPAKATPAPTSTDPSSRTPTPMPTPGSTPSPSALRRGDGVARARWRSFVVGVQVRAAHASPRPSGFGWARAGNGRIPCCEQAVVALPGQP